jgi:hypothetical protein
MSDFRDILGLGAGAAGVGARERKKEPALKKPAGVSREVSVEAVKPIVHDDSLYALKTTLARPLDNPRSISTLISREPPR